MRNKAILPLLEQLCMIAIFAIAAALCIQGYSASNRISHLQHNKDQAVVVAQNAAELLKHTNGDLQQAAQLYGGTVENEAWIVSFDSDWNPSTGNEPAYILTVTLCPTELTVLGRAEIQVSHENTLLFSLTVGWQEAMPS